MLVVYYLFFFFKQKTAYEMRISDWSSDVCSSDLAECFQDVERAQRRAAGSRGHVSVVPVEKKRTCQSRRYRHHAHGHAPPRSRAERKIGRASCRERVCQYV